MERSGEIKRTLGIGVLGYGAMGRAHSSAFRRLPQVFSPLPLEPRLVAVAGRSEEKVADFAGRFGYDRWCRGWEELLADERVELFDDTGPNYLHAEPCIAAAKAGKHVLCEKPLGRNAAEARRMLEAVQAAGVRHMCGFNYRFVPAIRLARQILEEGRLGRIYHFRARYQNPAFVDPSLPLAWRMDREMAGSGALGDLGSHIVDLARFLVGEPVAVTGATTTTFVTERPLAGDPSRSGPVTTDDAFQAMLLFGNGATGTLEASKMCAGSQNRLELEVNGAWGSLQFNLERLNELRLYLREDEKVGLGGFRTIQVNSANHPFAARWWPRHPLGWDHSFVHEMSHLLEAIAGNGEVAPYGATFEDGYRAAVICDAILASAERGSRTKIEY
jgi:predicted dehydrogenase